MHVPYQAEIVAKQPCTSGTQTKQGHKYLSESAQAYCQTSEKSFCTSLDQRKGPKVATTHDYSTTACIWEQCLVFAVDATVAVRNLWLNALLIKHEPVCFKHNVVYLVSFALI